MRNLILALTAMFTLDMGIVAAEGQKPSQPANSGPTAAKSTVPRYRTFADTKVTAGSPDEMAVLIRKCDQPDSPWHMTCQMVVDSFNALSGVPAMENAEQLAQYYEDNTKVVACPAGPMIVHIASVVGDKIVYLPRPFRPGEKCFGDVNMNRLLSSSTCFQWIKEELPVHPTFRLKTTETDNSGTGASGNGGVPPGGVTGEFSGNTSRDSSGANPQSSWLSWNRNGKWVALGSAAVVGTACAINGCFMQKQETTVCVGGGCIRR